MWQTHDLAKSGKELVECFLVYVEGTLHSIIFFASTEEAPYV